MQQQVEVVGAPGYVDRFSATLVLPWFAAVDARGDLAVVLTTDGELHVIPARTVHEAAEGEQER